MHESDIYAYFCLLFRNIYFKPQTSLEIWGFSTDCGAVKNRQKIRGFLKRASQMRECRLQLLFTSSMVSILLGKMVHTYLQRKRKSLNIEKSLDNHKILWYSKNVIDCLCTPWKAAAEKNDPHRTPMLSLYAVSKKFEGSSMPF